MATKRDFAEEGYSISITGKGVPVTDAIETYIREKLSKLERFAPSILNVEVVLDIQKVTHIVHMSMKFMHFQINVVAHTEDTYASIDQAAHKLYKLIQKYKKKLQNHHTTNLQSIDMRVNVFRPKKIDEIIEINDEIEEQNEKEDQKKYRFHEIVDSEKILLQTLTQDEAIMKMELSSDPFLVFKEEEDNKLKVIYRREDENFGIIEVE